MIRVAEASSLESCLPLEGITPIGQVVCSLVFVLSLRRVEVLYFHFLQAQKIPSCIYLCTSSSIGRDTVSRL